MDLLTTVVVAVVLAVAPLVLRYVFKVRVTAADLREWREALEEGVLLAEQLHGSADSDREAENRIRDRKKKDTALDHAKRVAGKQAAKIARKHGDDVLEAMAEAMVPRVKKLGGLAAKPRRQGVLRS